MSEQDPAFSLRCRPAPDDGSADAGGAALDHHRHPAAVAADASSSAQAHYSNTPHLPSGSQPSDQAVEQVSDGLVTGTLSRVDSDATFDEAAFYRGIAYPLSDPQPGDRLVRLVGCNGNTFWVTMEADADLGPESTQHDGWAEASIRSVPAFHDTRDAIAWAVCWTPVMQALAGYRPIEQLGIDDWTDILGPYTPSFVLGGPSTLPTDVVAGDGDVQHFAPQDEAVAPESTSPTEDDEPAPEPADETSEQRNPSHGMTAQTPPWRLGQIAQTENTFTQSRPSQTQKPAPIPVVAQRPGRAGSSGSRTGMRTGSFKFPCPHPGCPSGSTSKKGLKSHVAHYHQIGDAHAACLLCGKMIMNNADAFRRHRVGDQGCPQCVTVVEAAGDIQLLGWRLLLEDPEQGPELLEARQFGNLFRNMLTQWWAWEKEVDGPVWRWWIAHGERTQNTEPAELGEDAGGGEDRTWVMMMDGCAVRE